MNIKINIKTVTLIKGLESVTINRNFAINRELGYTHYGIFLGAKFKAIVDSMLGKQLPMTKKYCAYLWEVAQWAQLGALCKVTLPNLKSSYIHRYIVTTQYSINLTYNYVIFRDASNDTYLFISADRDTIYSLYSYYQEKQLLNLDMSILDIVENRKPSLKDRFFTWLKNALN